MEESNKGSFLKSVSGSADDFLITKEFSKNIHEYSRSFQLLDKAASFFYMIDFVRMRYLYVSENVKHILGYTAQDCIKAGPDWVFSLVHPEDAGRLRDLQKALFE